MKKPETIKKEIDKIIVDYIEGIDGIGKLAERMEPLCKNEIFNILQKSKYADLISIIDMARDIEWSTSQYGYNPRDTGTTQSVLENYYQKLKGSLPPKKKR